MTSINHSPPSMERRVRVFVAALSILLLVSGAHRPAHAAPTLKVTEHVHERAVISYRVDKDGRGMATLRACRRCDGDRPWHISPDTRLFIGDREIRLAELRDVHERGAMIFYDPETRHLNRIVLTGAAIED